MKIDKNKYGGHKDVLEWHQIYDSFEQAWQECHRGDWMIKFAYEVGVNDRLLTLANAKHAKLVLHLMKDQRSINAVHAAEAYGKGQITRDELDKYASEARRVTYISYLAAASASDAYASATSATATATAYASATSATATAYAAYAAYYAAYASAYHAAYFAAHTAHMSTTTYEETLRQCADICREVLTKEVFKILKIKKI